MKDIRLVIGNKNYSSWSMCPWLLLKMFDVDFEEIQKIKDKSIVNLTSSISKSAGSDDMLGIDSSWDKIKIQKHLRTEFQKWNNRVTTLPDGDERKNAQQMLELIAEAKKKYG